MSGVIHVVVNSGPWWQTIAGSGVGALAGVVIGGTMTQIFTVRNAERIRANQRLDQEEDAKHLNKERLRDLEREFGAELVSALDLTLVGIGARTFRDDARVVLSASAKLEGVATTEVKVLLERVRTQFAAIYDEVQNRGETSLEAMQELFQARKRLNTALRESQGADPPTTSATKSSHVVP
jgi:hypothetical protein